MATASTTDYAMLSQQLQRLTDELVKSQNKQTTDIMASQERIAYAGETRGLRSTDLIVDNIRTTTDKVYGEVQRQGESNILATERIGGAASSQAERIYGQTIDSVDKVQNAIQMQNERLANEQLMQAERIANASSTQSERIANALSSQGERIGSALGSQAERLSSALASQIGSNFAATLQGLANVQKQASDNYGLLQIEALKNKEDLAKQATMNASDIKDTLAKNEMDRLRDQLRKSETKELIYKHCHDHGDYYHHGHHGHHHRRHRRWGGDWDGDDDVNVRVSQTVYPQFPPFFGPGPFPGPFPPGPPFGVAAGQGPQGGR